MNRNAYMRSYMEQRYHVRMAAATAFLGGHCVDCGSNRKLEFDHVNPAKKEFEITRAGTIAEERFWTEVRKCVLRCRSCHEEKTLRDRALAERRPD